MNGTIDKCSVQIWKICQIDFPQWKPKWSL